MRDFNYKTGFTHGSVFHADDVFSAAFLKILNPEIIILRGNVVPENFDGIVFDIGFGEFDHHQPDNEKRENDIPYAAFGKLWRAFAPGRYPERIVKEMDESFICALDASDNGLERSQLADAVKAFNPAWNSDKDPNAAFEDAVLFAGQILVRTIKSLEAETNAEGVVKEAMQHAEDNVLVLPVYCPWNKYISQEDMIYFVVYPSARGGYCIHTVQTESKERKNRVNFPARWLGHPDNSLGMTFCHPGNFIACANTLEQAVNIARIAIKEAEVQNN